MMMMIMMMMMMMMMMIMMMMITMMKMVVVMMQLQLPWGALRCGGAADLVATTLLHQQPVRLQLTRVPPWVTNEGVSSAKGGIAISVFVHDISFCTRSQSHSQS
jgi:hypothetical protein